MSDELPAKIEGKTAVEVTGNILGTIDQVEPQIREGKVVFKTTMTPPGDHFGRKSYVPRKEKYLNPGDILSVGKDCVIISYGQIPNLEGIRKLVGAAEKSRKIREDLESLREEYLEIAEEKEELEEDLKLAEEKAERFSRMEDEYQTLKETVIEQEGKLKIARDYVGVIEELENMIRSLRDEIKGMEDIEKSVREIVNEELDSRGLRKTY